MDIDTGSYWGGEFGRMMQLEGRQEMPPPGLREEETCPERRNDLPRVTQPLEWECRRQDEKSPGLLVSCLPGCRRERES